MTLKEKAEEYLERWLHKSTAYYDKEQRTGIPTWLRDEASGPIIKTYLSGYKEALRSVRELLLGFNNSEDEEEQMDYSEQLFDLLKELEEE